MAEELAAAHMRALGFKDAHRTVTGADGGIDVQSMDAVAQVKYRSTPVGSPDIQRLRGAAHGAPIALFYSASGYTSAAESIADGLGIGLFRFDEQNAVEALNEIARTVAAPPELLADPELTAEEIAEEALQVTIRDADFRSTAWAWVVSSGRTRDWGAAWDEPDPEDLVVPAYLDRVSRSAAIAIVLDARLQFMTNRQRFGEGKRTLRNRERYRHDSADSELQAEVRRQYPRHSFPVYEFVELSSIRESVAEVDSSSMAAVDSVLDASSHHDELQRMLLAEARDMIINFPHTYGACRVSTTLPPAWGGNEILKA